MKSVESVQAAYRAYLQQRRERIATAVLQGMAASGRALFDADGPVLGDHAARAVEWADALILALADKARPPMPEPTLAGVDLADVHPAPRRSKPAWDSPVNDPTLRVFALTVVALIVTAFGVFKLAAWWIG